jgi:sec-independent protein translocase protein TatA
MGPLGIPEMMAIFVIALLLFGPKKLPELGRTLGKALSEFRRAKSELKSTFESHLQELERETRVDTYPKYLSSDTSYSSHNTTYDSSSYDPSHYDGSSYSGSLESSSSSTQPALEAPETASTMSGNGHVPIEPAATVEGTVARENGIHGGTPAHVEKSSGEADHV